MTLNGDCYSWGTNVFGRLGFPKTISSQKIPTKIKTLSKIKFETVVIADQSKKTHKTFIQQPDNNYSVPSTILIDNQNIVRWVGNPSMLNKDVLDKFISDQPMENASATTSKKTEESWENRAKFLFDAQDSQWTRETLIPFLESLHLYFTKNNPSLLSQIRKNIEKNNIGVEKLVSSVRALVIQ